MLQNKNIKTQNRNKQNHNPTTTIRIFSDLKSKLQDIVAQLNKAKVGSRKISVTDIIYKSLESFNDEQREDILKNTVTGVDRQSYAYKNYCKKNPKATRPEFIDLLIYNKINIEDFLPAKMHKV